MKRDRSKTGSAILEFTLCSIPLMFVWLGTVQMSIGMWHYHTLQYALKHGGEYLTVHGSSTGYCKTNNCRVQDVAGVIANSAVGMMQKDIYLTFTPVSASDHSTAGTAISCTLDNCLTTGTAFPGSYGEFEIQAEYKFANSLAMFATGSKAVKFGTPWFPGYTHQIVLF
jgi:Flp pilus assembly protein TadG